MAHGDGKELGRIDLGAVGDLVLEDDGDADTYVRRYVEKPNGDRTSLSVALHDYRRQHTDAKLRTELARHASGGEPTRSRSFGPFICTECSLTCPSTWEVSGTGICKNCVGDDR